MGKGFARVKGNIQSKKANCYAPNKPKVIFHIQKLCKNGNWASEGKGVCFACALFNLIVIGGECFGEEAKAIKALTTSRYSEHILHRNTGSRRFWSNVSTPQFLWQTY
jgi:hypothetical protein